MDIEDKKKIFLIIAVLILLISAIVLIIVQINTKIIDVSEAKHAITIEENVDFYKKAKLENVKIHKEIPIGTNIYVLEEITDKNGNQWSKVVVNNKKGYILSEKLGYFKIEDNEKILMADVSKFNKSTFKTAGEFGAFILNNNISYVYIRAGGRGYGDKGNFYEDSEYKTWADKCEFLEIPFGFYFLDEAINSEEINEEIEFIKEFLNKNKYNSLKLPIAIDIEKHNGDGRADGIWEERSILVSELIQKLNNNGISNIIYSNAKTANEFLSSVDTKFWIAYYPDYLSQIPKRWYTDYIEQEPTQNEELMNKTIGWQFTEKRCGFRNTI